MKATQRPRSNLPEPLSGTAIGSFAWYTIRDRLPKIGRQILEDNDFNQQVRDNILNLLSEIPAGTISQIEDHAAPDVSDWEHYTSPHQGKDWLQVPWFFAETYFYRRIIAAIDYYQPGPYQGYDPYRKQKWQIMETAEPAINLLGEFLDESLREFSKGINRLRKDFHKLLVLNVWGNQADLSMWSAEEKRPYHHSTADQNAHLLVDDAEAIFNHLLNPGNLPPRIDFVLDNYGPELVHDIALADYLLTADITPNVHFHIKPYPYFVSDAMIKDINLALDHLDSSQSNAVRKMAKRIQDHFQQGRLHLEEDFFWTSPLAFWDMPPRIYQDLSKSRLVIVKGDLNYRRLAGDLNWPPTTPFSEVVHYFPAPLLALRVHKAELALGLSAERVQELEQSDPQWMVNGNWAVIQFHQGEI